MCLPRLYLPAQRQLQAAGCAGSNTPGAIRTCTARAHGLTTLTRGSTCLLLVLKCTLNVLTDTHTHTTCTQPLCRQSTHLRVVQLVLLAVDAQRGEAARAGQDRVCGAPAALLLCPGLVSFVCRTHTTPQQQQPGTHATTRSAQLRKQGLTSTRLLLIETAWQYHPLGVV